jgi:hypothetical protein
MRCPGFSSPRYSSQAGNGVAPRASPHPNWQRRMVETALRAEAERKKTDLIVIRGYGH